LKIKKKIHPLEIKDNQRDLAFQKTIELNAMNKKGVIDAQVLFYFHYTYEKVPKMLQDLKNSTCSKLVFSISMVR